MSNSSGILTINDLSNEEYFNATQSLNESSVTHAQPAMPALYEALPSLTAEQIHKIDSFPAKKLIHDFHDFLKEENQRLFEQPFCQLLMRRQILAHQELFQALVDRIVRGDYKNTSPVEAKNRVLTDLINAGFLSLKEWTAFDLRFANLFLTDLGFVPFKSRQAAKMILEEIYLIAKADLKKVLIKDHIVQHLFIDFYRTKEIKDNFLLDLFAQKNIDDQHINYLLAKKFVSLKASLKFKKRDSWIVVKEVIHDVLVELIHEKSPGDFLYQLKVEMSLPYAEQVLRICSQYENGLLT